MSFVIELPDDEESRAHLADLRKWIRQDDDLRCVEISVQTSPPREGTMSGPIVDALQVALGPGGAATGFAAALTVWVRAKRRRLRMSYSDQYGRSYTVAVDGTDDPDELAKELQNFERYSQPVQLGR